MKPPGSEQTYADLITKAADALRAAASKNGDKDVMYQVIYWTYNYFELMFYRLMCKETPETKQTESFGEVPVFDKSSPKDDPDGILRMIHDYNGSHCYGAVLTALQGYCLGADKYDREICQKLRLELVVK